MAKFRVYEIAKKYNKDNKEILEILKANHVEVKNHMSTIGDEQIKMIDNALKPKKEAKHSLGWPWRASTESRAMPRWLTFPRGMRARRRAFS